MRYTGLELRFLFLAGELANHASAIRQRVEHGIAPAGRQERRDFLVDVFVGLSKKSRVLARRGRGKFTDGDQELGVAGSVSFLEAEGLKQCKLLIRAFLRKFPVVHKTPPVRGHWRPFSVSGAGKCRQS